MDIFDTIQESKSEETVIICNIDDGDEVTVEDAEEEDYMDIKDEHNKPLINIEDSKRNALDDEDEDDASTFDAVTAVGKILIFKPRKKRARCFYCCLLLCQKVCEKVLEFNHSIDSFIQL